MSRMRHHRPLYLTQRLGVFLFALSIPIICYALPTHSDHVPNSYNWVGKRFGTGGNSWTTKATFSFKETTSTGVKQSFVSKTFATSTSTLGSLARNAALRGRGIPSMVAASLIASGIINGAGWAIDELRQQVLDGMPTEQVMPGGYYYARTTSGGPYYISAYAACNSYMAGYENDATWEAIAANLETRQGGAPGTGYHICRIQLKRRNNPAQTNSTWGYVYEKYNNTTSPITVQTGLGNPISDEQIGEKVAAAPAEDINELLAPGGNPQMTPELVQVLNDLRNAHADADGVAHPDPVQAPSDPGQSEPQAQEKPWPGFCEWATPVCEFIKWVKTDDEADTPTLPIENETVSTVTWSSGLGGGSCPSPENVTISVGPINTSVAFSYEIICNAMSYMKPVFITMAGVLAAFIVGGFRGGRHA